MSRGSGIQSVSKQPTPQLAATETLDLAKDGEAIPAKANRTPEDGEMIVVRTEPSGIKFASRKTKKILSYPGLYLTYPT